MAIDTDIINNFASVYPAAIIFFIYGVLYILVVSAASVGPRLKRTMEAFMAILPNIFWNALLDQKRKEGQPDNSCPSRST